MCAFRAITIPMDVVRLETALDCQMPTLKEEIWEAMTQDPFEIKYVTGTKVYLDDSGETVITIGYVEIPDSHQPRIVGSFAASSSVAEAYCRQLMEVLGIKEKEWPNGREPKES